MSIFEKTRITLVAARANSGLNQKEMAERPDDLFAMLELKERK